MIQIEPLQKNQQHLESDIARRSKKIKDRLEKVKTEAIKQIENQHIHDTRSADENYQSELEIARQNYYRSVCGEIMYSLQNDVQILQKRSGLIDIAPKSIEKARTALQSVKKITDDATKTALMTAFSTLDEEVGKAMDMLSQGPLSPERISTYIAVEHAVFIISPVNLEKGNTNGLEKNLESILECISKREEISLGTYKADNPKNDTVTNGVIKVPFSASGNIKDGYVCYVFTPSKPEDTINLSRGIVELVKLLQPEGFEVANLTHVCYTIEPEIMRYFMENKGDELYSLVDQLKKVRKDKAELSDDESAKIMGRTIKSIRSMATKGSIKRLESGNISVDSLIDYYGSKKSRGVQKYSEKVVERSARINPNSFTVTTPYEVKQEAYERLKKFKGESNDLTAMTQEQFRHVIGINSSSGSVRILQCEDMVKYRLKGRKRVDISIEGVEYSLSTRDCISGKWIYNTNKEA